MKDKGIIILGGGLAGLTAGYFLGNSGRRVIIVEKDPEVGGLAKTIVRGDFRFDLGGHRFFTKNKSVEHFVRTLMKEELLTVSRKSKIFLSNKFFDYPLKPANAIFGLGLTTTLKIIADYSIEKVKNLIKKKESVSLEDWVVSNFGRTLFDIYFKGYSEKVWGMDCSRISEEWVSQRIKGLSLGVALKQAFFKFAGKDVPTLADRFLYPLLGIGRISEKLEEAVAADNVVLKNTSAEKINREGFKISDISARNCDNRLTLGGETFISTIPINLLVKMLEPAAPSDVLEAASALKYRDAVIVAVMIDRPQVTDQTWIYIPEKKIRLGRLHEPKNWSISMAPEGKTLIVVEYFCFQTDDVWKCSDDMLGDDTIKDLQKLGFINKDEVIGTSVVRVPRAYPILEVGYRENYDKVCAYLRNFKNLHILGRTGAFRYHNMDHVIEAGMNIAETVIKDGENT